MRRFLLRRLVFSLLTMWGITIVVFILSRLGPDPILLYVPEEGYGPSAESLELIREKWGLNDPLPTQYAVWIGSMFKGDFGTSMRSGQPVTTMIRKRLPATLQLGLAAWILSTLVGVSLGMFSAWKRASLFDYLGRGIALIGQATPSFWLAILAIYIFAVNLEWLPVAGRGMDEGFVSRLKHMILPVTVLSLDPLASYLRLTRSSMLEILDSEYIKLARAKGVGRWTIIGKHALKNASIQPLTVSALVLASFITGVLFIEQVFAWPGIGRLAVTATWNNDFQLLAGAVLLFGVIYVVLNFTADMLYATIDPRIRYT